MCFFRLGELRQTCREIDLVMLVGHGRSILLLNQRRAKRAPTIPTAMAGTPTKAVAKAPDLELLEGAAADEAAEAAEDAAAGAEEAAAGALLAAADDALDATDITLVVELDIGAEVVLDRVALPVLVVVIAPVGTPLVEAVALRQAVEPPDWITSGDEY